MAIEGGNILTWLDELRFSTENYEPFARPLSGGTTELSLLLRQPPLMHANRNSNCDADNTMSPYQKLWECTSDSGDKRNKNGADSKEKRDNCSEIKHADVCRVSVVFQNCEEVEQEDAESPVRVENIELYLSKDVLEWITDLWYSSEEEDVEEFEVKN
ncbi:hypothetical protein QE152_g1487 [Popillia japonica]|uniref:Uncharacterized protein n=1 Tax=Popillia japonica TaxID=7064 RepID=A0AAW1N788_POPJA